MSEYKPIVSRRLKTNILVVVMTFMSFYYIVFPVADDAVRAYNSEGEPDRIRLFKFYVAARYYGFPYAIERYGVGEK